MSKGIQFTNYNKEKVYPCPYFPIGSLYLSVSSTNPTKWFGGKWEQIAKGRTLVGVDTSQAEFNTVKKTGGEKVHTLTADEMPEHYHKMNGVRRYSSTGNYPWVAEGTTNKAIEGANVSGAGGSQPHNNLQPYFTCYIWLRTS